METTVRDIATLVGGTVAGKTETVIRGASGILEAGQTDITFLKDVKKKSLLGKTSAGAILVPADCVWEGKTLISVSNPLDAFAKVLATIAAEKKNTVAGIHPSSVVAKTAILGKNVSVGPLCVIEDGAVLADNVVLAAQNYVGARVRIGESTLLYPHVTLREDVQVGARCILHSGSVIGADGFGFYFAGGKHNKIPQVGTVIIEDDVEIGACTAVDRATTGATRIGKGTKIDNLVQVAHNVEIGPLVLLAAQVGIAGSTKLGKGVVFGGQAGIADHINVGDGAQIGGQSGVIQDVEPGAVLFGNPAQPILQAMKQAVLFKRLPQLFQDVKQLKEKK